MAHFFIDRPIFAWVIAIMIMFAGLMAILTMPVEQYPDIAPPRITVSAQYTGASAETTENSVTQVIERGLTGLDNLLYMNSTSNDSGRSRVTLTFQTGTNPDTAQVQVQNKLESVIASLPQTVQTDGVRVFKSGGSMVMVVSFVSPDGSMTRADLADFMSSTLEDQISRVDGVGEVSVMGSKYAMRIWLNPEKLKTYALMPSDIVEAIRNQNRDVAVGSLGALPAVKGQLLSATVSSRTRLTSVEDFENILLKTTEDGAILRLKDVAQVEIGSERYNTTSRYNGMVSANLGIDLASGANILTVAEAVKAKLDELSPFFPSGVAYHIAFDNAPFVRISIHEVVKTLFEAIVLVVLIMFLFLQNWRVTLIPVIAVPVVILGTFGVLAVLGFSINTLSMFALVLAIGLLVDDAIVVVENVERLMKVEGLAPREAAVRSMSQITGALIGIVLVLTAVFIPMAFFTGSTGAIYRQFSVTITAAMGISMLVALTITPALCATMLKPLSQHEDNKNWLGRFFNGFNHQFQRNTERYSCGVRWILQHRVLSLGLYVLILGCTFVFLRGLPSEFLPQEDQGELMAIIRLPAGSTQQQTLDVINGVSDYIRAQPEVDSFLAIAGFGMGQSGQNTGMGFVELKDWADRDASAGQIGERISAEMRRRYKDSDIFLVSPSGIPGLGSSAGFEMELLDIAGAGREALTAAKNELLRLASLNPKLRNVRYDGYDQNPTLRVKLDDVTLGMLGIKPETVDQVLNTVLGSTYVNDFINGGRIKRVIVQGEADARMQVEDIGRWAVRNNKGEMVPFSAFSTTTWENTPNSRTRFGGFAAMEISAEPAEGVSTGEAMQALSSLVAQLPGNFGYAWTGIAYQQQQSGNLAPYLYAVSIFFVFLCLAALYESWSIPFSVLLAVPIGLLGAVLLTYVRGLTDDVYFQIGLLATIGLAAKNAILIVEFARSLQAQGEDLVQATCRAANMRLRPIIMTSMAFLLGVLPLMISSGAGAAGRQSLGTGVFGGTLSSTFLGVFFVPLFYVVVRRYFSKQPAQDKHA